MQTITIAQVPTVIAEVNRDGDVPLLWGPPGCGKSEGVHAAFEAMGAELIDIRAGQYDSVDVRGFPVANSASGITEWLKPGTIPFKGNPNFDEGKPKGLFIDELTGASIPTQGVLYQLIQDGRVGEHVLMDNTYIVAATNRATDRGATNRLALPLANRFVHFNIEPDAKVWCEWAAAKGHKPELIAFMRFREELISTFDPSKPDMAFATPRTWDKAGRYLARSIPEDVKMAMIQGAIGEGPANELWGFIDVIKDMPKLSDIEKNPTKVPVSEKPEIRYAVAAGISGSLNLKNVAPFDIYLRRMDPEFGIMAWQLALKRDKTLAASQEFIEYSKLYRAVFAR